MCYGGDGLKVCIVLCECFVVVYAGGGVVVPRCVMAL